MKKWLKITILVVYLLGVFYLVLPTPVIPNLEGGLKSQEPGDTTQMPGVWAYYTNLSRREAVDFYKKAFSRSWFLKITLPTYILNHPPEYARETIRATQQSNFYEEIVHPLRESLFVNGWIPKEDKVYLAKSLKPITEFYIDGEVYSAKITLYSVRSPIWLRLLVWTGIVGLVTLIGLALRLIILSPWWQKT
ncbi:hypothetical protein FJZ41_00550 [Candidatus Shapirobacteria bacterium]|nr:hypothetical protein [Candidatus Shapirobacteria bacterium]